ncbi:MAG: sporulation protein YqfD [Ruminococcus sp.]|nr:sporulation protein YqfD [Ruminococcus sp.]
MKDQIRGCVKINAKGSELYSFINHIHDSHINCYSQYVRKETFCAEIYRSDLEYVKQVAEEHGITLTAYEYDTISAKVLRRRSRFGLVIGMIIVLAASLYFSNVVITIEIQGNTTVSDTDILSALDELGIKKGTPFGQINYVICENRLQTMVDGVSWAGMHRTGHRLVVEVTEIVPKPKMINTRMPCNVVSAKEAVISETFVLDGRLMHIVGDYVRPGDLLVSGVTTTQYGDTSLHHAMADIIGIYTEEESFSESLVKQRSVNTGNTDTRTRLQLFSFDIPLYLGENKYERRDTEKVCKPLKMFGKVLPISLTKYKYTELETIETELTPEECTEFLMEKVYLYEKNFLSDCEILERDINTKEKDGIMTMNVKYRLKGDICEQKEIFIK